MRPLALACTVFGVVVVLAACSEGGDTNKFPDVSKPDVTSDTGDVTPDSDAGGCTTAAECTGLTLGTCDEAACESGSCVAKAIPNCCEAVADCSGFALGDCEKAACTDNRCVAVPDDDCCPFPGGCCEDNEDCAGLSVGTCEKAVCSGGACIAEDVEDCCETVADCDNAVTACESRTCVANTCGKTAKADCCISDADCSGGDGCCSQAKCNLNNTCSVVTLADCCEGSTDCDDGNPSTVDVCVATCVEFGCDVTTPACDLNKVYTSKDFDDGTLQALKPKDANINDKVVAASQVTDAVSAPNALYFGDPACNTYFNGPLDSKCVPTDPFANGSTALSIEVETPDIALDAEAGAIAGFWVKMAAEPALEIQVGPDLVVFDTDVLKLSADDGSGAEVIWKSTAAKALGNANTTGGEWRFQVARMATYAGKSVKLKLAFTADSAGNYNTEVGGERWYGAYVDSLAVRASCAAEVCTVGGPACPSDGQGCTADVCTPYALGEGGVCGYQAAVLGESCTSCGVASDCGSDPCLAYACTAGICSADLKPECCLPSSSFPTATTPPEVAVEGFEDADIADWEIVDPFPTDNVTWSLTSVLTYAGGYALFFGDPVAQNYVSNEDKPALATAWSPSFVLEDDPFRKPVASFWLWLSTEYDGATNPDDGKFDKLTVLVEAAGEAPVTVWDSFSELKNTTNFGWAQVGIDLTAFGGKSIRLGFKFDSVDSSNEIGKGVRIDELTVTSQCIGEGGCITASDCNDDSACTTDWCELGACNNEQEDPLCCAVNADCEDSNACTTQACVEGLCDYAYDAGGPACCEGAWVDGFVASFESDADGFTVETDNAPVTWYRTDAEAHSGTQSFTFSNPTTGFYANPAGGKSKGRLISKPVTVPPFTTGRPYAEFWYKLSTEWDLNDPSEFLPLFVIDQLKVSVAVDGNVKGATKVWVSDYLFNTTQGAWVKTRVDLDAYRDKTIQLVFAFEGDGAKDNFAGAFVDSISFNTTCKPAAAIKCVYGGNCTAPDACAIASCSDEFLCVNTPKDTPECCEPFTVDELGMNFEAQPTDWSFTGCDPGGAETDTTSKWSFATNDQNGSITVVQGTKTLYFGNGTDYGGAQGKGSCGTAESPEVSLGDDPLLPWEMSFQVYVGAEKSPACAGGPAFSDVFTIRIEDIDEGSTTQIFDKIQLGCNDYAKWVKRTVDLSAFAGKTVKFHFSFDTFDDIDNEGPGVAVDDIQFVRGCVEDL